MTLSITTLCLYAECHYAECRVFMYCCTECHYVQCHYAECRYAECCDAVISLLILKLLLEENACIKMTLSLRAFFTESRHSKGRYADCPSLLLCCVIVLNLFVFSVFMLRVVILSVVAPPKHVATFQVILLMKNLKTVFNHITITFPFPTHSYKTRWVFSKLPTIILRSLLQLPSIKFPKTRCNFVVRHLPL